MANAEQHIVIIGGGLAGLSAGCYARSSGFRTTIVEHNLALGGVCTAWARGQYVVDGCIHWLTGGPFARAYEELKITPGVPLKPLEEWCTYRNLRDGTQVTIGKDLEALLSELLRISPLDGPELRRVMEAARKFPELEPPTAKPQELMSLADGLRMMWDMKDHLGTVLHFRKPVKEWAREHLSSLELQRFFSSLMPEPTPLLFLLMVLGYLNRGWLSRPVGGTRAFRDALVERYQELGGDVKLNATVDEILVDSKRARGVRLSDGTIIPGDLVVSTSSSPETMLRLLGGRYEAESIRQRLAHWKLFDPIVLASFGVEDPLAELPGMLVLQDIEPFALGGYTSSRLYLRICNDDPAVAPPGHAVVQAMAPTTYEYWATRGSHYQAEKDKASETILAQIERYLPGTRAKVRMTDVATPLTYWNMARSWQGAYEGWMPSTGSFFGHVSKRLSDLGSFYMAGQWVEPGGGVPTAINSGRQVVQLICHDTNKDFIATT